MQAARAAPVAQPRTRCRGAPHPASRKRGTPAPGGGDVEIPLGIPVSTDEWNELKESARRPAQVDEDADNGPEGQAQQDTRPDEH